MTRDELTNKLKKIGFKFTQPEFCTKDSFLVVLDCYPYLIESGKNKSLFFTTWYELIKFYNVHIKKTYKNENRNKKRSDIGDRLE